MNDTDVITSQPRERANAAAPTPSTMLAGVPRELDHIANMPSLIFRPKGPEDKTSFEILDNRDLRPIFDAMSLHGECSYAYPAISIFVGTREILQLQIDPFDYCCSSISSGTVSSPPGSNLGKAVQTHYINGYSAKFEIMDTLGNTVFLSDARRRWDQFPAFELTTADMVSIGRISVIVNNNYGVQMTLQWFIDDVSALKRILGLGFMLFLYLWRVGLYRNAVPRPTPSTAVRHRSLYGSRSRGTRSTASTRATQPRF